MQDSFSTHSTLDFISSAFFRRLKTSFYLLEHLWHSLHSFCGAASLWCQKKQIHLHSMTVEVIINIKRLTQDMKQTP